MVINTQEAIKKIDELKKHLKTIKYNWDLYKLLGNLNEMAKIISKKEVEARRTKNKSVMEKSLKDFNEAVTNFEHLLIIAKLLN